MAVWISLCMYWEHSLCSQIHCSNSLILMWNYENSRRPFIIDLTPPSWRSTYICLYVVLCCPLDLALVPYFPWAPNITGQLRSTKFSGIFLFSWLYFFMSLYFFLKEYDFNSMRLLQLLHTLPLLKFPTGFSFDPSFICIMKLFVTLQAHHDIALFMACFCPGNIQVMILQLPGTDIKWKVTKH